MRNLVLQSLTLKKKKLKIKKLEIGYFKNWTLNRHFNVYLYRYMHSLNNMKLTCIENKNKKISNRSIYQV